jgi:hypothetical protein
MDGGEGANNLKERKIARPSLVIFVPRLDITTKKRGAVGYPMLNKLLMTMFEIYSQQFFRLAEENAFTQKGKFSMPHHDTHMNLYCDLNDPYES